VACLEEVAYRAGFISQQELERTVDGLPKSDYRQYLRMVCEEGPTEHPSPVG
jgi:glucose-1-phosphate thymidylyltransferase